MKPSEINKKFERYARLVDTEIKGLLAGQEPLLIYDMISYFMGYLDENLKRTKEYGGKRFRPGITLALSDFYGCLEEAIPVAAAIEIFHNFTLIHDDVEDHDELRRGRETVWKKWGINHAINTGDAQLILGECELQKVLDRDPILGARIQGYLNKKFLQIAEGQYMDFALSELHLDDEKVNKDSILDMMGRKSGILIGASAVVAGIVAGVGKKTLDTLWDYGLNLGLAYQISDDYLAIWGKKEKTGKNEHADIKEKKKTLPIIFARDSLSKDNKNTLAALYNKDGLLSDLDVKKVRGIIEKSKAKTITVDEIQERLKIVSFSIKNLGLSVEQQEILEQINDALFAEFKLGVRV